MVAEDNQAKTDVADCKYFLSSNLDQKLLTTGSAQAISFNSTSSFHHQVKLRVRQWRKKMFQKRRLIHKL